MNRLVLATADLEFEARVRDAFNGELNGQLRYWRRGMFSEPQRLVEDLAARGAKVVALGPGIPHDSALELARAIDHDRPDISTVIVAEPSTELLQLALHAGARDVIAPESPAPQLRLAFERALGVAEARRTAFDGGDEASSNHARVVVVVCPKGGAGKTTVSTNLALGLARLAPEEVVVVDLDLQFGDVASALGLSPEATFSDAVRAIDRLDATTLKANLAAHAGGLYVLCAPVTPIEVEAIHTEHVDRIITLLAESFRYIVVDTASGLDEHTLSALELATDIVLLSATDVPAIRSTQKEVAALRVLGKPDQRWHFVLNRADARTGLTIEAIETALGISVDVAIPSSRSVPVSLNNGVPLIEGDPRAPVSLAIAQLARLVAPQATRETNNGGSFWRRAR